MIKDLLAAGGPGLLIPIVLFALLLYTVRGLFGLHGRRSQHRREFLEHWDQNRADDDLWLEVTIRHLYGTNLPAHVIRTSLKYPHSSQALIDLSELWEFYDYDSETQRVSWQNKRRSNRSVRATLRFWPSFRYFFCAAAGVIAAYVAAHTSGWNQWIYAFFALISGTVAFLSLWHNDAEKIAWKVGEEWIERINSASPVRGSATKHRK